MCKDLLGFLMFSLLWPLHRTCLWHKFSIHQFVVAGCQNYPASYHLFPLQFVRFLGNTATGVNAVKPCLCLFLNTYPVLCQIKRLPLIGIWEGVHVWQSRGWEYRLAQWAGAEVSISQERCREELLYPEGFSSPSRWEVPPMTLCCCKLWTPAAAWATPVGAGVSQLWPSQFTLFFPVCDVSAYWELPMVKHGSDNYVISQCQPKHAVTQADLKRGWPLAVKKTRSNNEQLGGCPGASVSDPVRLQIQQHTQAKPHYHLYKFLQELGVVWRFVLSTPTQLSLSWAGL